MAEASAGGIGSAPRAFTPMQRIAGYPMLFIQPRLLGY